MATQKDAQLLFTIPSKTQFTGRYSSVSIHPTQDVAVCVFDNAFPDQNLYYSVGTVDKAGKKTFWGPMMQYDTGKVPSVALTSMEGSLYAIETHDSGLVTNKIYFRVGKVDQDQKTIDWGDTSEFCSGQKPKVCANSEGTVVIAHEEKHLLWGEKIHCDVMKLNVDEKTLERPNGMRCEQLDDCKGVEPGVALRDEKVVLVYRSGVSALQSAVGELRRDQTRVEWNKDAFSTLPFPGKEPSIGFNSSGDIMETHQTALTAYRLISYNSAHMDNDVITWKSNEAHLVGEYPAISLADDGCIIAMHKTNFGANLYQSQGELRNQE